MRMTRQPADKDSTGRLRLGTSGYDYNHWRKCFYPRELPRREWFGYYAGRFDTVEINNTFYRLPSEATFDEWRERASAGFEYALKFSRYGSHLKHLKDPGATIGQFMTRADRLRECLGPILVQLPPRWKPDPRRLDRFLRRTPTAHRWAVELRDSSWFNEEVFDVLRRYGAALCIHDMIPEHPRLLTTDWAYMRFHGRQYTGSYSPQFLSARARLIADILVQGYDAYVYFNNDDKAHAVHNALALKRYVEGRSKSP